MNIFENILGFVTDNTKQISTRATVIVLAICCFLFIDNIVGFSYYYNRNRQLEQLKSISLLLQDTAFTEKTLENIRILEKQTFQRKNIVDYSVLFLRNIFNSQNKDAIAIGTSLKVTRSNFWFLISTSGVYIILSIFVPLILLITAKKTGLLKILASMLIFVAVMFFTSWFNYWLFDKLIPDKLFGHWIWNYILNFIIQIGLIVGIYWATNIINKTEV